MHSAGKLCLKSNVWDARPDITRKTYFIYLSRFYRLGPVSHLMQPDVTGVFENRRMSHYLFILYDFYLSVVSNVVSSSSVPGFCPYFDFFSWIPPFLVNIFMSKTSALSVSLSHTQGEEPDTCHCHHPTFIPPPPCVWSLTICWRRRKTFIVHMEKVVGNWIVQAIFRQERFSVHSLVPTLRHSGLWHDGKSECHTECAWITSTSGDAGISAWRVERWVGGTTEACL